MDNHAQGSARVLLSLIDLVRLYHRRRTSDGEAKSGGKERILVKILRGGSWANLLIINAKLRQIKRIKRKRKIA
jgi:hypothetical protein